MGVEGKDVEDVDVALYGDGSRVGLAISEQEPSCGLNLLLEWTGRHGLGPLVESEGMRRLTPY